MILSILELKACKIYDINVEVPILEPEDQNYDLLNKTLSNQIVVNKNLQDQIAQLKLENQFYRGMDFL